MTERENLPAEIIAQAVAVLSEQRGSLVGRGLAALRKDNDALYRQARVVFDRGDVISGSGWLDDGIRSWNVADDQAISSALKIFQQLADENYGKAYFPLSHLYLTRQEDIEECLKHAQHFEQLAFDWCFANRANQDVELWCDLGEMYGYGHCVKRNDNQAAYQLRKAADKSDVRGKNNLDYIFEDGFNEKNFEQAMYWFRKTAEQGNARGQMLLGKGYQNLGFMMNLYYGYTEPEEYNEEQAVYWFRKAAEQGNADAQQQLGHMYSWQLHTVRDEKQAVYWLRKAAEQGLASAQSWLGEWYLKGHGVEQNDEQAVYWFRRAAEQGDAAAQETIKELGFNWKK